MSKLKLNFHRFHCNISNHIAMQESKRVKEGVGPGNAEIAIKINKKRLQVFQTKRKNHKKQEITEKKLQS